MESVEKLIQLYNHLSYSISGQISRTAQLIECGDWQFAGKRLLEELEETVQAFRGQHKNLLEKDSLLAELAAEKGIDQRLSGIILETSQLSYWYLVFHLAKLSLREHREKPPETQSIVRALEDGARSTVGVEAHALRIRENPTVETVYSFVGRVLAEVNLPLDIFAELDLREMRKKPYLEDFFQRGFRP